jgi:hypothetical protein
LNLTDPRSRINQPGWGVKAATLTLSQYPHLEDIPKDVLFIAFVLAGQIGGFGSHYMTTRLADVFLLVSVLVLIASILAYVGRWQLSLASTLMLALWVGSEMVA